MDTERGLARVALHEAAHAVGWGRKEIRRVGLVGPPVACCIVRLGQTGRYWGETQSDELAFALNGGDLIRERVVCWLAGREAELESFGGYDTIGASHDLVRARNDVLMLAPPQAGESEVEWEGRLQREMDDLAQRARQVLRRRWVAVEQVAAALLGAWRDRPAGATEARLDGRLICEIIDAAPVADP